MQIFGSWQPGPVWAVPKPGLCWTPGRLCADRHFHLHSHIVAGAVQHLPQCAHVTCAWLTHSPLRACLHCLQTWQCTSAVHRNGSLVTCNLSSRMAWHASPVQAASPLRGTPAWGSEMHEHFKQTSSTTTLPASLCPNQHHCPAAPASAPDASLNDGPQLMNATLILLGVDPGSFTHQLLAAVAQAVQQQLSFPDPVVNGTSWAPAILVIPATLLRRVEGQAFRAAVSELRVEGQGPSQLCHVSSSSSVPRRSMPTPAAMACASAVTDPGDFAPARSICLPVFRQAKHCHPLC